MLTMLADIGEEQPAEWIFGASGLRSSGRRLLEKKDVAPGGGSEGIRVVVRLAREIEAISRDMVPLFASNLACFASDTNGSIC
jgi:hypothetical protein